MTFTSLPHITFMYTQVENVYRRHEAFCMACQVAKWDFRGSKQTDRGQVASDPASLTPPYVSKS